MLLGRFESLAAMDRLSEGLTSLAEPLQQLIAGKRLRREPLFGLDPGAAASASAPASAASSAATKAAPWRLIDALAAAAEAMGAVPSQPGSVASDLGGAGGAREWLGNTPRRQPDARDVPDADRQRSLDRLLRSEAAAGPGAARLAAGLLDERAGVGGISFEVRAAWQALADELAAVLGGPLPRLPAAIDVGARLEPGGPRLPDEAGRAGPPRARPPGRFEFHPLEEFGRFLQQGLSARQRAREGREQEIRDAVKKLAERGVRVENFPPPAPATFAEGPA
jgi:hypothetical protein